MIKNIKNNLLKKYVNLIFNWNQKFNLTGFKTMDEIFDRIVNDVIFSCQNLDFENLHVKTIMDAGSGNGSPGIILAILYPEIEFTLVESNQKKCDFLFKVKNELFLKNIKIICSRIENLDNKYTEIFDLTLSRAVASIAIMNELLCRWTKVNKYILHFKSLNYKKELSLAIKKQNELGLVHFDTQKLIDKQKRTYINVIFQKKIITSSKYPRTWKDIKKDFLF